MNARDLLLSPDLDSEEIHHFLVQYGFHDIDAADRNLQKVCMQIGDPFMIASIAEPLIDAITDSADPDSSLRGISALFEALPNLPQFIQVALENPLILEVASAVTGGSEFLTLILLRNPGYIYWLMESGNLDICRQEDYFQREASRAERIGTDAKTRLEALQRFQRREVLRIGAQDLLQTLKMEETALQISLLADAVLDQALRITAYEHPLPSSGFVVLGMGKLGGRELNFSSDVDLVFLYGDESEHRTALKFARAYRKILTERGPEGHFYRVDLRLRPMGNRGEAASSLKAAENYYKFWADTTDRLALIKARPVAGEIEMGTDFLNSLQGFVYKKYQDYAAVEEIRLIKQKTDRELRRRDSIRNDIKLGLGGIREIEFFVQSFQLLYGGLNPGICSPNTLKSLDLLLDHGFIERDDHSFLRSAYMFLRDLEHKIQLVNYLQTQTLPGKESELYFCARRMGYRAEKEVTPGKRVASTVKDFSRDLAEITGGVNKIFSSLLQGETGHSELAEILLDRELSDEEAVKKIVKACSPRNPAGILEGIQILSGARAFPHSPQKMRNLLANLLPFLLDKSSDLKEPRELFTRLDRFAEALGGRVALYQELAGNQSQAEIVIDLLSSGPFLSEILIKRPELTDYTMIPHTGIPDYPSLLADSVEMTTGRGRSFADALRLFKQSEEFKLGVRELPGPGTIQARTCLTRLAEACLESTVEVLFESHPEVQEIPFAIAALGKMGGSELIFHSDLDLLFVFDRPPGDREAVKKLLPFVKSIKNTLQEYTQFGKVYSLDFRLRPEGRSTTDIISLQRLEDYFGGKAEAWERLAYVKARPILERGCSVDFPRILKERGLAPEEIPELMHIRKRKEMELGQEKSSGEKNFKIGRGGLLDSQFYIQMLQLEKGLFETNTLEALEKLKEAGHVSPSDHAILLETIRFIYALESAADLTSPPGEPNARISETSPHTANMARLLNFSSARELLGKFRDIAEKNRGILLKLTGD